VFVVGALLSISVKQKAKVSTNLFDKRKCTKLKKNERVKKEIYESAHGIELVKGRSFITSSTNVSMLQWMLYSPHSALALDHPALCIGRNVHATPLV
jgi:hypothetical protein